MRNRGVVLFTTLLMVIIVTMVVAATISQAPTALSSAASYTDQQRALLAVDAGVAYAKARFKEDLNWLGSHDSGPNVVVQTPDGSLVVVEDHGNVVGTVKFDDGDFGQFRIRFNHQDGSSNAESDDGFADPNADFMIDTPQVSANNLMKSSNQALFEAEAEKPAEPTDDHVQAFQAHIAVEGLAGPALRDVDPMKPNSINRSLRLVRRLGEARLEANYGDNLDAAAMAAGNLTAHFSRGTTDNRSDQNGNPFFRRLHVDAAQRRDNPNPPRVRTKKTLSVTSDAANGPTLYSQEGYVNTSDGEVAAGTRLNSTTTPEFENESAGFYSMSWDDVSRPDPSDPDTLRMQAGTYVVKRHSTASGDVPRLHYYDMSLEEYTLARKAEIAAGDPPSDGLLLSRDLREVRSNYSSTRSNGIRLHQTQPTLADGSVNTVYSGGLRSQLIVKDPLIVDATADTNEFNFISEMGYIDGTLDATGEYAGKAAERGYLPQHTMFQFIPRADREVNISAPGDIHINGRIQGTGASVVSEGNIRIVGAGALDSNEVREDDDGLSLYAKEDVSVSTLYPLRRAGQTPRYASLNIKGVVYAWGDVNFHLAPERDTHVRFHGKLRISGAVVAYGGDPGSQTDGNPGSGSGGIGPDRGNIDIRAYQAFLRYNPNYLLSLDKLVSPSDMEVLSFTLK